MVAWLAPALAGSGALLSAFGSSKAADAAGDAAKTNYKINKENLEAQQANRQEAIDQALLFLQQSDLGITDAYGNRQYYDPDRGWVTELSPMQQIIADLVEQEQIRQGSEGARRAAENEQRMASSARESALRADAAGSEYDRVTKDRSRPLAEMLMAAGQRERTDIADRVSNDMARTLIRGGSNADLIAQQGARAREDMAGAQDAAYDAILKAKDYTSNQYASELGQTSDLLKMFTEGANYSPNYSLNSPEGPKSAQGAGANVQSQLLSILSGTPQQDYVQPDYSQANKFTSIGNTISGLGDWYSSWQKNQQDQQTAA